MEGCKRGIRGGRRVCDEAAVAAAAGAWLLQAAHQRPWPLYTHLLAATRRYRTSLLPHGAGLSRGCCELGARVGSG